MPQPSAQVSTRAASDEEGGFLSNLGQVLRASDRSGMFILLAILCWFLGYNALETWVSSFGKFSLGIDEGRMSLFTSGLAFMFVIFALPSGLIATRYGRRHVILVGIAGLTIAAALRAANSQPGYVDRIFDPGRLFLGFD